MYDVKTHNWHSNHQFSTESQIQQNHMRVTPPHKPPLGIPRSPKHPIRGNSSPHQPAHSNIQNMGNTFPNHPTHGNIQHMGETRPQIIQHMGKNIPSQHTSHSYIHHKGKHIPTHSTHGKHSTHGNIQHRGYTSPQHPYKRVHTRDHSHQNNSRKTTYLNMPPRINLGSRIKSTISNCPNYTNRYN